MSNKIIGIILIAFGTGILLSTIETIRNDSWPIQKILFVSSIQILIALVPLIIGTKILKKPLIP